MAEHRGPPFPSPTIDEIRRMPQGTAAERDARIAAARVWLVQFCARARFVLEARNLTVVSRADPRFTVEIDKVRQLLDEAEVAAALAGT